MSTTDPKFTKEEKDVKGKKPAKKEFFFSNYVEKFIKTESQIQTHTWFSPTRKTKILHVPWERNDEFMETVFNYVTKTPVEILENPTRGENAITEKVSRDQDKFRMFADIDFKVELFEKHSLPSQHDVLVGYMSDLVRLYDATILALFGPQFLDDRVLAIRLPYKLHIIYPSLIVNKKIACRVSDKFDEKIKRDSRFTKAFEDALQHKQNIVDTSVYGTGLRLPGMHKSTMGNKNNANEKELQLHENIFGENKYSHRYRFVDIESFDLIPFSLETFKSSSIRVPPDVRYSVSLDKDLRMLLPGAKKERKEKLTFVPDIDDNIFKLDLDSDEEDHGNVSSIGGSNGTGGDSGTVGDGTKKKLAHMLEGTVKWLTKQYNHVIDGKTIRLLEFEKDSGENNSTFKDTNDPFRKQVDESGITIMHMYLIFPLTTKECHFKGKDHNSNRQFLYMSKYECYQKCHDCRDKGKIKPIRSGKFPYNVKTELYKLGVIESDALVKVSKKKDLTVEEKTDAVQKMVYSSKPFFPKNDLVINHDKMVFNDLGVYIPLEDLWCEICKVDHQEPCTYFHAMQTGQMSLSCAQTSSIGKFYPNPPVNIDIVTRQLVFSNCNITINRSSSITNNHGNTVTTFNNVVSTTNVVNNYADNTGDVSIDFEEETIFEDIVLNHLMFESLTGSTWSISKVLHHLTKHEFACTKNGVWYAFKGHRWVEDAESAVMFYISDRLSVYYRQVRDYYKENTENPELKARRVNQVQKIVEKLSNNNPKCEVLKEAKGFFFEDDFYRIGNVTFEQRLDKYRNFLCFTNGVLNLDTDEFRHGSPFDFITMCVDYPYTDVGDPQKRIVVESFFQDIQPDVNERMYLLLFLASLLHGATDDETFHILTGSAANGKSLLRDIVMAVLGEYFGTIPANLLTKERPGSSSPQPEIVKLKGKRAIIGSEPEKNQKINTGYMKFLTGNDPVEARNLHSNSLVAFQPHFKLIMLCNDIPLMDNNDNGVWRRSRILEFPVVFCDNPRKTHPHEKKIDRTLKSKIESCKQEFFLYLFEHFRMRRTMTVLKPTDKVNKMVDLHRLKSNTVEQFIKEQTEDALGDGLLVADLYPRYLQWMRAELPGERPLKKTEVIGELEKSREIEFSKYCRVKGKKGGGQNGIKNCRLVNNENNEVGINKEDDDDDDENEEEALNDVSTLNF